MTVLLGCFVRSNVAVDYTGGGSSRRQPKRPPFNPLSRQRRQPPRRAAASEAATPPSASCLFACNPIAVTIEAVGIGAHRAEVFRRQIRAVEVGGI
jgi:hypothetical protein